jgi:hypothetical protein
MAAFFSLLINVAMSLTSSSSELMLLSCALTVPAVADRASVVPMLKVSPNILSRTVSFDLGGSLCLTRLRSQRLRLTKL